MTRTKILICFISILSVSFVSSRAGAVGMSSKRDCVVCHIMWLDSFRTDKESLVPFQPGNVLMKDTQGVVSSEDICYSCHDGYVMDSRHIAWNKNRHPTFVKPSESITVPPDLPLSVKGEIYCGTCHSAHGKGASAHGNPMGRTKVYRELNVNSSLCEKCHSREATYKTSNSHPVHSNAIDLPDKLFELGAKEATSSNEVICQSCHKVHGAEAEKILITSNKNSELCELCHEHQKNIINTKHDLRVTLPEEKNIRNQALDEAGPCSACHTPHNALDKKLWARPVMEGNPASQLCLGCHGDHTDYKTKRIGTYSHPIDVRITLQPDQTIHLPLFAEDGSKHAEGKVQCFSCHDIHTWDPSVHENTGGKDVEGDASNSFLRITNTSSVLCLECHQDKKQVTTSDHNLAVTAPGERNAHGFIPEVSGPCGVCHVPHNATAKPLWAKELPGYGDYVSRLCSSCHEKNASAGKKLIGKNYHPIDVSLGKMSIITSLPLYNSEGIRTIDGKVFCTTCHDPHIWDPNNADIDYNHTNMEGDTRNSFLRMSNFPSSDLCKSCHKEQAYVDGTDHDMNVTSPDSRNLLNQTVQESGQCGACHLVHNSPNKLKLWARPYGSVYNKEDIIDSLCNSCHSRGNIAKNKIPMTAMHPEDKLVNNTMRCDRTKIDFAPIFDKHTGLETNVGNISCPTCHDAHRWSPLTEEKGENRNIEGDTTNSFLRNVSYNNICIDCHGLDALFRYKYFHDPEERVEPLSPVITINN
ncbi:MAG: cytochrome c3 family protein [Nitrospiraceae bacterium]|nr:MAG: cytochrome c3 family protein [Nitrospiraceae bacterium]